MIEMPDLSFSWNEPPDPKATIEREWLVTNGLAGFSSSTLAQVNTRRYHGFFVPALPAPVGRAVMIARLVVTVHRGGEHARLDGDDSEGFTSSALRRFRLHGLVPEWEWHVFGARILQRLVMVHGQNTLFSTWEQLDGEPLELRLRPFHAFRELDRPLPAEPATPTVHINGNCLEVFPLLDHAPGVKLRTYPQAPFVALFEESQPLLYRVERGRGLDHVERQKSAGYFACALAPGRPVTLGVTSDDWMALDRHDVEEPFLHEAERQRKLLERLPTLDPTVSRLLLATDQFVIAPTMRPQDEALARATGQDARSVIAGYPWFTDWGRDTMISLEGLTLSTGRYREAAAILRTFSHYVRDGLLPNLFPEGGSEGLYHTADATLWFFHAIARYMQATGDRTLTRDLYPTLEAIMAKHISGTRFGIGVDPKDGLLRQGADGYQLTWMDAKVDGWVVTPRRGKAVEINALWFNALRYMAEWAPEMGRDPGSYRARAEQAQTSFNKRFFNPETGCLFDVVDDDDPAIRPNQIFAMSLDYPVLRREAWASVLAVVERELVTPVGLRSLSRGHPDYKATYDGDLRSRDAAYHQGTVWAWLMGHYIDAWCKHTGQRTEARQWLLGLRDHLRDAGVGQVSEIFDASEPYTPRGCFAQAWSSAELLRAWLKTE